MNSETHPPRFRIRSLLLSLLATLALLTAFFWVRFEVMDLRADNASLFKNMARTDRALSDAESLLSGEGAQTIFRKSHDDVGFAFLVAAAWKATGERTVESIHWMTLALDFVSMLALSLAVWRWFGKSAAWVCAFLYAGYLPLAVEVVAADIQIYQVHFASFLLVGAAFLPQRLGGQIAMISALGLLSVLASMIRGTFSLYAVALGIGLFLKYGPRRGSVLAGLLILISVGGLAFVKGVLGNPTHIVAHHLFTGLADFPNPFGIVPVDTRGWEEARNVSANCEPYSQEYLAIVKARALTLMDENPRFYAGLILKRIGKVLYAGQRHWWYLGFGFEKELASVLMGSLFILSLIGLAIAIKDRLRGGLFFLLTFLYFGAILVAIVTFNENYYLATSIMQIVFAGLALSRIRLNPSYEEKGEAGASGIPLASSGVPFPQSFPQRSGDFGVRWSIDPFDCKALAAGVGLGILFAVLGTAGMLAYANSFSHRWKAEFLDAVAAQERIGEWPGMGPEKILPGPENPIARSVPVETGYAYLFHTLLEVERGRVALDVRDASGAPLCEPTYTLSLGRVHCFTGWYAGDPRPGILHARDALPVDPIFTRKREEAEQVRVAYDHYGILDHAKWVFEPDLRVSVSGSTFPNGHADMPFLLDKLRWSNNQTVMVPPYWGGPLPAEAKLAFAKEIEISQAVFLYPPRHQGKPILSARGRGTLFDQPLQAIALEQTKAGEQVRYFFEPVQVQALTLRFEEPLSDPKSVYLCDLSLPDAAKFRVLSTTLYRTKPPLERPAEPGYATAKDYPEGYGYPTHLSFLAEE